MHATDLFTIGNLLYAGAAGLLLIGLYGLVAKRNVLRALLALGLLDAGGNLLMVAVGYRPGADAPIAVGGMFPAGMVDPIPQALILTAIVIGVGVLALGLALAVRVYETWGTLDLQVMAERIAAGDRRSRQDNIPVPAAGSAVSETEEQSA